ncbi:MAG: M56 family metallopeptidase [Solirubrobacteraceae bacterium]
MATTVDQPAAATAASRVFGAGLGLGVLGLGAATLVLARLVESWHVTANASSHHVTLFGERLGYPAANLDAVIVLVLAVPSLAAIVLVIARVAREGLAATTRRRVLERRSVGTVSGARLIEDERPLAFCAGLLRPRVYISTGAAAMLDERALAAVLEHERHHAGRRDPLRLAAGRVLAGSLFFVPGLRELARAQQTLSELGADEAAVSVAPGGRPAMARAILGFVDTPGGAGGRDGADRPAARRAGRLELPGGRVCRSRVGDRRARDHRDPRRSLRIRLGLARAAVPLASAVRADPGGDLCRGPSGRGRRRPPVARHLPIELGGSVSWGASAHHTTPRFPGDRWPPNKISPQRSVPISPRPWSSRRCSSSPGPSS